MKCCLFCKKRTFTVLFSNRGKKALTSTARGAKTTRMRTVAIPDKIVYNGFNIKIGLNCDFRPQQTLKRPEIIRYWSIALSRFTNAILTLCIRVPQPGFELRGV